VHESRLGLKKFTERVFSNKTDNGRRNIRKVNQSARYPPIRPMPYQPTSLANNIIQSVSQLWSYGCVYRRGTGQVLTWRGSSKHQPPLHSLNISQRRQWHKGMLRLHTSWGWRHEQMERREERSSRCCHQDAVVDHSQWRCGKWWQKTSHLHWKQFYEANRPIQGSYSTVQQPELGCISYLLHWFVPGDKITPITLFFFPLIKRP